jgi:hypothetical protein
VHQQPQLVQDPLAQQRADQRGAANGADVLAGLLLQRGELLRGVAGDEAGVPPLELLERGGDHQLGVLFMKSANRSSMPWFGQ